jgi:histidyl-tRNA synthetase
MIDLLPASPAERGAVALLHDDDVPAGVLLAAKREARASAPRVRLERARRNRRSQLDALAAEGFTAFVVVTADGPGDLRPLD